MRKLLAFGAAIVVLAIVGCEECEYRFDHVTVTDCGERGAYVNPSNSDGFYVDWTILGTDTARKIRDCGGTISATDVVGDRCNRTFEVRGSIRCD